MSDLEYDGLYNKVERCLDCGSILHIVRKRYCCGKDFLAKYLVAEDKKYIEPEKKLTKREKQARDKRMAKIKKKKKYKMDKELKASILKRDKYKCAECGNKNELHVHHKKYREHGGTDEPDNLITLCQVCHTEVHRGETVYNIMIKSFWDYQTINEQIH